MLITSQIELSDKGSIWIVPDCLFLFYTHFDITVNLIMELLIICQIIHQYFFPDDIS